MVLLRSSMALFSWELWWGFASTSLPVLCEMGADTVSWTATATSNHLTTFCERNATEGDAWEAALLWNSIAVILYAWGGGRFGGGGRRFPYFGKFGRRGRGLGGLGGGLIASNGVELQTLKGGWEMKCCLRKVEWVKRDEAIGKSVLK